MRQGTVNNEARDLQLGAKVTLYEVDYSGLFDGGDPDVDVLYLTDFVPQAGGVVAFGGKAYTSLPITLTGIDVRTSGNQPRPTIEVADFDGALSDLSEQLWDLTGAEVRIRRTFEQFLDSEGQADAWEEFTPIRLRVSRRVSSTPAAISFELSNPLDVQDMTLPGRTVEANYCPFRYKSGRGCIWDDAKATARSVWLDVNDQPVPEGDPLEDCGKTQTSCRLRFGELAALPFGGFPGAMRPS